MTRDSYTWHGQ